MSRVNMEDISSDFVVFIGNSFSSELWVLHLAELNIGFIYSRWRTFHSDINARGVCFVRVSCALSVRVLVALERGPEASPIKMCNGKFLLCGTCSFCCCIGAFDAGRVLS
ncbi:hypothetical protein TSUD_157490 [Trifolium subterraneum]|uniref:Uncharacterized protein n=1 Tax=Trifolium subterraneum TaxID=3900 RepID=A0A2Z6LZT0_TRISU|nr:hypothetical protein TSUD_157490 [Trifolium subterraneum]